MSFEIKNPVAKFTFMGDKISTDKVTLEVKARESESHVSKFYDITGTAVMDETHHHTVIPGQTVEFQFHMELEICHSLGTVSATPVEVISVTAKTPKGDFPMKKSSMYGSDDFDVDCVVNVQWYKG